MNGHHLILGELDDFVTGQRLADTHDERYRQRLSRLLVEEKVALVPGSAFGATGAGHVRACYAAPMKDIEEALTRIGRFVEKHAP